MYGRNLDELAARVKDLAIIRGIGFLLMILSWRIS
jgi:hypothetical protein